MSFALLKFLSSRKPGNTLYPQRASNRLSPKCICVETSSTNLTNVSMLPRSLVSREILFSFLLRVSVDCNSMMSGEFHFKTFHLHMRLPVVLCFGSIVIKCYLPVLTCSYDNDNADLLLWQSCRFVYVLTVSLGARSLMTLNMQSLSSHAISRILSQPRWTSNVWW